MTGMVTASWISAILVGSAMRATPPSALMSAGTRSSAMTATAPAPSAIRACSASVTSMITPPLSISARPLFTRIVPSSAMPKVYPERLRRQELERRVRLLERRNHVDPRGARARSLEQFPGELEAELAGVRARVRQPLLHRLRDGDARHLVVE